MMRCLVALLAMCFVTSPQALPSSGVDERTGELKSYRFSDSKTDLTRSAPGMGGNMDPLFLRAFGFEGDVSVMEQFNVSETIPWSNYRPRIKPGEIWTRMRFSPSWRPIRGYGGYLSSLKIKWNGNLLGETRRLELYVDTNFVEGILSKSFDECGRNLIDDHGNAIYLRILWKHDSGDMDMVKARKKCVSAVLGPDADYALDLFLQAFPFYLESQECAQRELIPIVAELFGRNQTECGSNRHDQENASEFLRVSRARLVELLNAPDQDLGSPPAMSYDTSAAEVCRWAMTEWRSVPGSWAKYAESRGLSMKGCEAFLKQ